MTMNTGSLADIPTGMRKNSKQTAEKHKIAAFTAIVEYIIADTVNAVIFFCKIILTAGTLYDLIHI